MDVSSNGNWSYKEDYDESPGSIMITERREEDGYTYTKKFHSSGVVPRTATVGLDILRRAVAAADMKSNELKAVLSYRGE